MGIINIPALNQAVNAVPKTAIHFQIAASTAVPPSLNALTVANCQYLGMVGHVSCGWCSLHNKPFQICENASFL